MTITRDASLNTSANNNNTKTMNQNRRFPFTKVWVDLITLLQEKVSTKRRYLVRASAGPVFSGANAVDVLFSHVRTNPEMFPNQVFGRSNCVRLCQRFLDFRVFLPTKESSQLKLNFGDSKFAFYRFNEENDFIGAPKVTRSMKRCNSETDLLSVTPSKLPKVSSTSGLLKLVPMKLRRSIRRKSSSKPDPDLGTITEQDAPLDTTLPIITESTPVITRKRATRSNAFRLRGQSSTSTVAITGSTEDLSTPPVVTTRRRSFAKIVARRNSLETRKKVKSIANFNLSLSIAL